MNTPKKIQGLLLASLLALSLFIPPLLPVSAGSPEKDTKTNEQQEKSIVQKKKTESWVAISSPKNGDSVDPSASLPVQVDYEAWRMEFSLKDKKKTATPGSFDAIELLINGKSLAVQELGKSNKKAGTISFSASPEDFPQDATEMTIQARAYDRYQSFKHLPSKLREAAKKAFNHVEAESEIVTLQLVSIVGSEGGIVKGKDGFEVVIPPGAFSQKLPVTISENTISYYDTTPDDVFSVLSASNLDIGGEPSQKPLDIIAPLPPKFASSTEDQFLVAETVWIGQNERHRFVDIAEVENGKLISRFVSSPFEFFGIVKSSVYTFLKVDKPVGYIKGQVFGADGSAIEGVVVTVSKLPTFVAITSANGEFQIPILAGEPTAITAFDPKTGESKTVNTAVSAKGDGNTVDITIIPSSAPLHETLQNGGFEENLNGWTTEGAVSSVTFLGNILPRVGEKMAMVGTGAGSVGDTSSAIEQRFKLNGSKKVLKFDYNFVSEEFPEFIGSAFNDSFSAVVSTPDESKQAAFVSVNSATDTIPAEDIDFPGGDQTAQMTGWKTASVDLSGITGDVVFSITDLGDTIYDSVVLIDNVRLEEQEPFMTFPLEGGSPGGTTITSVMDRHGEFKKLDGIIETFDGQIADIDYGWRSDLLGDCKNHLENLKNTDGTIRVGEYKQKGDYMFDCEYKQKSGEKINLGGVTYTNTSANALSYLAYDGHSGYDFAPEGKIVAAASGTLPITFDPKQYATHEKYHRYDLAVEDENGKENGYAISYLHMTLRKDIESIDHDKKRLGVQVLPGDVIGTPSGWGEYVCKGNESYIGWDDVEKTTANRSCSYNGEKVIASDAFDTHLHLTVWNGNDQKDPYGGKDDPILWASWE